MCNKLSFSEIVDNFIAKFGYDWCSNIDIAERVTDAFIDYLKSMPEEQFNYEKVKNLI